MATPRVFVSHATADAQFANRLAEDLRSAGADVWLDSSHMGAGDFVARINNALQSRDVVVLVLSPAAIQSNWVSQEFNAAIARTQQGFMRPPIVIMSRPCKLGDIPPLWTVYHRYDASNDYSAAMHGVARELGLGTPTTGTTTATPNAAGPLAVERPSTGPRTGWVASYVAITWAAGIAAGCIVLYRTDLLGSALGGNIFALPLIIGVLVGIVSWVAAVVHMLRLGQLNWLGLLALGGVCAALDSFSPMNFELLETGRAYGGVINTAALLALACCGTALAVGLFGPTSRRSGK